jgi:hypothetical protein
VTPDRGTASYWLPSVATSLLELSKGKGKEGVGMKRGSGVERFVPSSGRITLECECGEKLTITNSRVGEEVTVAI